jgi:hypothetical protein
LLIQLLQLFCYGGRYVGESSRLFSRRYAVARIIQEIRRKCQRRTVIIIIIIIELVVVAGAVVVRVGCRCVHIAVQRTVCHRFHALLVGFLICQIESFIYQRHTN